MVLSLQGVSKWFGDTGPSLLSKLGHSQPRPVVQALDGVDLAVRSGEFVGLVGESGSGKSTLGRIAAGLMPASKGEVRIYGRAPGRDKSVHRDVQMIFQDPQASLNPRMRIDQAVGEAPLLHRLTDRSGLDAYVSEQLVRVGLNPAVRSRFPHQFSGGQRQRVNIARALALQPRFLVCDESVAALDVSIQAQILNLFMDLREELKLTYLFISHDLRAVQHICDRVVIMYLGRIVEDMPVASFSTQANHPYTKALLEEIPDLTQRGKVYSAIKGEIPSPLNPPSGCHFHPRCPLASERCRSEVPRLKQIGPAHRSACHLNDAPDQPNIAETLN
ncbi:ABC transporter ATP-binding protein [Nitratireductor aquimarinus]|nr:ABC transporter ATP-binding protein [Nitratireductor pacificus]MBN7779468.1 ABC transporter ATP-binding protein [Nitratireductor pacificus]MBN7788275.1 ABC transporter ATP-binding protein [Nitratireductor aquimarinus]MBY6098322.1 ABC transporter ATP-binding protein [Nitratireductor aquimarinus]